MRESGQHIGRKGQALHQLAFPFAAERDLPQSQVIFEDMYNPVYETFLANGEVQTYAKGDVIYKVGQPADTLYFVQDGLVKVFTPVKNKDFINRFVTAPGIVGEEMFLEDELQTTSAQALSDCTLLAIDKPTLKGLENDRQREVVDGLVKILAKYSREKEEHLAHMHPTVPIAERLSWALVRLWEKGIPIPDQLALAEYLGSTRATISKETTKLAEKGAVRRIGHKVIVDVDVLPKPIRVTP